MPEAADAAQVRVISRCPPRPEVTASRAWRARTMTARSMTDPMAQAMGVAMAPVVAMSSARPSTEAAVAEPEPGAGERRMERVDDLVDKVGSEPASRPSPPGPVDDELAARTLERVRAMANKNQRGDVS